MIIGLPIGADNYRCQEHHNHMLLRTYNQASLELVKVVIDLVAYFPNIKESELPEDSYH